MTLPCLTVACPYYRYLVKIPGLARGLCGVWQVFGKPLHIVRKFFFATFKHVRTSTTEEMKRLTVIVSLAEKILRFKDCCFLETRQVIRLNVSSKLKAATENHCQRNSGNKKPKPVCSDDEKTRKSIRAFDRELSVHEAVIRCVIYEDLR